MKKLIVIVLSFCMVSISSYAQEGRLSIGISAGAGVPVGLWGKKDFVEESFTGFVKPGLSYDLSVSYKIGKGNFGLTSLIRRQTNVVDTEAMADAWTNENPSSSYKVDSDDWRMNQFLLGGFVSKSITDKLDLDFRILAGVINVNLPLVTVFVDEVNWVTSNGDTSMAFAYSLGTGVKYHIGNKLDFLINVDYLRARPEFDIEQTSDSGFKGNSVYNQSVMSLNLSAGIAIKL